MSTGLRNVDEKVIVYVIKFLGFRARGMIAKRLSTTADKVKNTIIWGNHSSTQFPDLKNASVVLASGKVSAYDAIKDEAWIKDEFITVKFPSKYRVRQYRSYCTRFQEVCIYRVFSCEERL